MKFNRIHLIVLDSVGIGEAPDADKFGDVGSDTLGHVMKRSLGWKFLIWKHWDWETYRTQRRKV